MSGYLLSYIDPDGLEFALYDGVDTWLRPNGMTGFGALRVVVPSVQTPFVDGATLRGRPYTPPRVMSVEVGGAFSSHAALTAALAVQRSRMNPYRSPESLGTLRVVTPDRRERRIAAWPVEITDPEMDGAVAVAFAYVFEAPFPFFYDPTARSETFGLANQGGVAVPWVFDDVTGLAFAEDDIDHRFTATNNGDVDTWPTIVIYGPGDSPTIENETTGKTMALTQTMDAGDTITIDMDAGTISFYDASAPSTTNIIANMGTASEFWALRRGDNTIHVTMSNANNGSAAFSWHDYYTAGL